MNKTDRELVNKASKRATEVFNELPFDLREKLANPAERLSEINLLLHKGDNLSIAFLKKRKKELEEWLIDWFSCMINKEKFEELNGLQFSDNLIDLEEKGGER